jgi:enoyl-CoA hydratase/carnithine racemase
MGLAVMTHEPVWVLEIARAARRNAVDADTARSLASMLQEAGTTAGCRAAVLVGQGGCFCAGSDLKELGGREPEDMGRIETAKAELARALQEADIPVIAAVEGFALGGGLALAAACDIVVSAADARWHMPEVANGWLPPWGIEPVVQRCGPVRARRVLWGAQAMDAAEAHALGLVDTLCAPGEARATAMALAQQLAALPPLAARGVKRYLRDPARSGLEAADRLATHLFVQHCRGAEARATLARFLPRTA